MLKIVPPNDDKPSLPLTSLSPQQQAFVDQSVAGIEGLPMVELTNLIRRMLTQSEVQTNYLSACVALMSTEQLQSVFGVDATSIRNDCNSEALSDC